MNLSIDRMRTAIIAAAVMAANLFQAANAQIKIPLGTWHFGSCSGAQAGFLNLHAGDKVYGFGPGGSPKGAQASRSETGSAGVKLNYNYQSRISVPKRDNDFKHFTLNFNGDDSFHIRFCFVLNHGTGATVSYDSTLKSWHPTPLTNGWREIDITAGQFENHNIDARNSRLITMSVYQDSNAGKILVGGSNLTLREGFSINPDDLDNSNIGCNFTCEDDD